MMTTSGDYGCRSISEGELTDITATLNFASGLVEIDRNLQMPRSTNEMFEEDWRISGHQLHGENFKKPDNDIRSAISKWQLRNMTKCAHENALNTVLSHSMSLNFYSTSSNPISNDIELENEAVLTAIELKGLKQHDSMDSESNCHSQDNHMDVTNATECHSPSFHNVQHQYIVETMKVECPVWANEIQESPIWNDEIQENFMAEAVSTAIEVTTCIAGSMTSNQCACWQFANDKYVNEHDKSDLPYLTLRQHVFLFGLDSAK